MSKIHSSKQSHTFFTNPVIWADVPDPDVIRVGDVFYMSSTTMHMNPGVPIMKSHDLVNWEIVNYVYDILANREEQTLCNGKNEYGKGSWASSLRYHDGTFYLAVGSLSTQETYIFQTENIETGTWSRYTIDGYYHDMSLLFDDDGRVYMVYDGGDIKVVELTSDATAIKEGGLQKVIIPDASLVACQTEDNILLKAEGAHIHKVNGMYYIFTIAWPKNGNRTQVVHRASQIDGVYEGRICINDQDDTGTAQGGIVDTVDGRWYAMLFQDSGSVGRCPWVIPVTWEDDWPVFGDNGYMPKEIPIPIQPVGAPTNHLIVASDEFSQAQGTTSHEPEQLANVWQWNHNPDNENWSLTERPGFLRLTTGHTCATIEEARNTLTQRTYGPKCSGHIALEIGQMKNGDVAGLAAFQKDYGFVGVKMEGDLKNIVMVNAMGGSEKTVESFPATVDRIYFKVDFDFTNQTDKATFFYSVDDEDWREIGNTLQMSYKLDHFMGYRFALFNYATKTTGGYVDFDYFRVSVSE
ncbi:MULTISPECIES: glycoside hydrolase 43 family protein [Bacillaceae]|uniref:Glycoside hydrolase 43 family protein n=1 Tax=Evansella alkalicola TaxID=745819 RepID=A0ABS6JY72_9BACI|nr:MULTISPECIES: glycoside hydrolase 43 family protein [Bacillaceae]MBU9723548.1 glycoside hydrolase 43 family protein [Bacillus alkalicola]